MSTSHPAIAQQKRKIDADIPRFWCANAPLLLPVALTNPLMDPLSISASIAGLLALVAATIETLSRLIAADWNHALDEREVLGHVKELENILNVLHADSPTRIRPTRQVELVFPEIL